MINKNFEEVLNRLPIAKEHKAIILQLVKADSEGDSASIAELETKIAELNKQVTAIPTYSPATISNPGLLSAEDKQKLDGLVNYKLTPATTKDLGGVKASNNIVDVEPSTITTENLAGVVNSILAALRTSGILK